MDISGSCSPTSSISHAGMSQCRQRWFAAKNESVDDVSLTPLASLSGADVDHMLSTLEVTSNAGTERYFLPFTLRWKGTGAEGRRPYALAKVRRGARLGTLYDGA